MINSIAAVEEEASSAERDPLSPSDVRKNSLPSLSALPLFQLPAGAAQTAATSPDRNTHRAGLSVLIYFGKKHKKRGYI